VKVSDCVTKNVVLPDRREHNAWEEIVADAAIKDRLLNSALLALEVRSKLPFETTASHGLLLLYGPPGTGKTTLARAAAHEIAGLVSGGKARLIEINPHGLMSAEHGQSQQKVSQLLTEHVPLLADDRMPTVLVLDEVESMVVARSAASLSANPADVHRATDAVLSALDRTAAEHPHIITIATSNFTEALDEAFQSRADAVLEMPLPSAEAIELILVRTLRGFADAYPALGQVADAPQLAQVAERLVGCDGRQVRKFVTEAMSMRMATVLDPGALTLQDLDTAAAGIGRNANTDRSSSKAVRNKLGGPHAAA
jgi:SpoVK/Ycf46/Vps4 family AAA+-type ATPase